MYFSVDRFELCEKAMLLEYPVLAAVVDPQSTPLIRSCTLVGGGNESMSADVLPENPRKAGNLFRASCQRRLGDESSGSMLILY